MSACRLAAMSTASEVLQQLEALGSEQTRRTYLRHGATPPLFGVKFADLYKLQKRLGTDHALAEQLWATGNADARNLAALIADPTRTTRKAAEAWLKGLTTGGLIDAVAGLVASGPDALACAAAWTTSKDEWRAHAGWTVVGRLAGDPNVPDATLLPYLAAIEPQIHGAPNRAREAMNRALIAIGGRSDALARTATAAAKRIGTVEVDHGDTDCKTPEAVGYIAKIRAHAAKKTAKTTTAKTTAKTTTKATTAKKSTITATAKKTTSKVTAKKTTTKKSASARA